MADSLITFFLNKSNDLLQEEWKISTSAQKQLESLVSEAKHMSIFLRKADSMDIIDEAHRECLKQVREILFNAEDSIEKYMLQEGLFHRRPSLKKMLVPFESLRNKHRIYADAEDLKSKATHAIDNLHKYTVDFGQGSSSQTQNDTRGDFRNDTLLLTDAQLVGIEGPREHLVQWLLKDDVFLVVAIHGMAGIGKTTLANSVYRDGRVKRHFPCRVWANVSESYDIKELLKRIVERLCNRLKRELPTRMDDMDDLSLRRKIQTLLKERPYILVLNDVWSNDLLHSIKYLIVGTRGRLIITTRHEDIADAFVKHLDGHVYKMDLLSEEDSFELFCRKTFRQDACPRGFAEVSEKVSKMCGRLPLAINAVSGLFIAKPLDLNEWSEECDRLGNALTDNQGEIETMKKIFSVSINTLPYDLKACFLYLSIFPCDHAIQCSRLIRLWMAEGFVKQSGRRALEQANEFLKKLLLKNLIEVAETTSDGRIKTCRVHTILHKIIVFKSKDVEFALIAPEEDQPWPHIVRRFSIQNMVRDIGRLKRLRSLFVFEQSQESSIHSLLVTNFRMLHVLDLQGTTLRKFPKNIVNYKHLRYLSLRGTKVNEIPESIGEFQNLETLDLKHTLVSKLPRSIRNLKLLCHLLVYRYEVKSSYPHFHFKYGFKAPSSIGDLKSLQKLCIIDLSRAKPSLLTELGRLNELRRLVIINLRKKDGMVLCSSIEKLNNLNALSITSASEDEFVDLPFSSEPPPKSLQRLYLTGCLEELPKWMGSLRNLVKLFLRGSRLSDDPLDSLKDLEKLEHLELQQFCVGQNLKFPSGGFSKLRLLGLDDFHQLTQVEVEDGALLALQKLTIQRCKLLRTLPEGIALIKNLGVLELYSMHEELIKAVHKNGPEYWKIEDIPEVYIANWITEDKQWEFVSAHTGAIVENLQLPRSWK